jgi:hypothetical protein
MKNKIRHQTISGDQSKFFRGEKMTCCMCVAVKKSSLDRSSNWTVIDVDGRPFYVCDLCFPGVHKPVSQNVYDVRITLIFTKIAYILASEKGGRE